MPHNDNPVGRLFLVMDGIWNLPTKSRVNDGFRNVLGVEGADEHVVLKRMASVFRLPAQARREAELLESISPDHILEALPAVETVLKNWTGGNNIEWFQQALGAANVKALSIGSDALSRSRPQPTVGDSDLQELASAVDDLAYELDEADLAPVVADRLQGLVDEFREAISAIDIDGVLPLRDAADRAVGVFVAEPELRAQVEDSPFLRKLGKVVASIYTAVSMTAGPLSIPASADYLADAIPEAVEVVQEWLDDEAEEQPDESQQPENGEETPAE